MTDRARQLLDVIEQENTGHGFHRYKTGIALNELRTLLTGQSPHGLSLEGLTVARYEPDDVTGQMFAVYCDSAGRPRIKLCGRNQGAINGKEYLPTKEDTGQSPEVGLPDDDEPQNWRDLAEAILLDLERYCDDETPNRRRVSAEGYRERFGLLDRVLGPLDPIERLSRPQSGEYGELVDDLRAMESHFNQIGLPMQAAISGSAADALEGRGGWVSELRAIKIGEGNDYGKAYIMLDNVERETSPLLFALLTDASAPVPGGQDK